MEFELSLLVFKVSHLELSRLGREPVRLGLDKSRNELALAPSLLWLKNFLTPLKLALELSLLVFKVSKEGLELVICFEFSIVAFILGLDFECCSVVESNVEFALLKSVLFTSPSVLEFSLVELSLLVFNNEMSPKLLLMSNIFAFKGILGSIRTRRFEMSEAEMSSLFTGDISAISAGFTAKL